MNISDKKHNLIDIIIYSMMVVAVGYIVVHTILGNNGESFFKITLGLWMLIAIIVSDFVEPLICEDFDRMTGKAAAYYGLYAVFDAVAYVSLYIFIINIGLSKEPLHYVFLGIAVLFFAGRIMFSMMFKNARNETPKKAVNTSSQEVLEDDIEVNTLAEEDDDIKIMVFRNRNN